MKKINGNSMKMVISIAGMAICLLSGCGQDNYAEDRNPEQEQADNRKDAGLEELEAWREAEQQNSKEGSAAEAPKGDSQTDTAGPEEETSALFYAQEIPEEIFARMDGVSYVENDNISLEDLRYLRLLYVGFDEQTHVGELVVHESIADTILEIFHDLYENGYQIEKMRLIDDYGGDDHASLLDNNTSAFNYRVVEGSEKLSRHAYGLAIDINPFYNPYVTYPGGVEHISPEGSEPYADREADFPHKIGKDGDLCWQLFSEHGFTWGGDWKSLKDYQHFQISK